jgi:biopolymer transport protein ExbD
MRTGFILSLALAAWVAVSVPAGAADAAPPTVLLRAGQETPYQEIAKVLKALAAAKVAKVEVETTDQQAPGVSAVIRAQADTPYKAVVRVMAALQAAGVGQATCGVQP